MKFSSSCDAAFLFHTVQVFFFLIMFEYFGYLTKTQEIFCSFNILLTGEIVTQPVKCDGFLKFVENCRHRTFYSSYPDVTNFSISKGLHYSSLFYQRLDS